MMETRSPQLIRAGAIRSAHDLSEGGLFGPLAPVAAIRILRIGKETANAA
jgi:phosphoribosylformylglycinamidine (FGAM) synthase-like enzyme